MLLSHSLCCAQNQDPLNNPKQKVTSGTLSAKAFISLTVFCTKSVKTLPKQPQTESNNSHNNLQCFHLIHGVAHKIKGSLGHLPGSPHGKQQRCLATEQVVPELQQRYHCPLDTVTKVKVDRFNQRQPNPTFARSQERRQPFHRI